MEIFTDGACSGNPGHGGWGLIVLNGQHWIERVYKRYDDELVTNNRMELEALLKAIEIAENQYPEEKITIYCDSAYCVNICNNWIFSWAQKGWINSRGVQIENYNLVRELWKHIEFPKGKWKIEKIKGHAGIPGNELADALARGNAEEFNIKLEQFDIANPIVDFINRTLEI